MRSCDDLADDPEAAIQHAISEILPEIFQEATCFWQLSSSAGFSDDVLKVHLFYWLTDPVVDPVLKASMLQHAPLVHDRSVYQGVQPHYIAAPIIEGRPDPLPRRTGMIRGLSDAVSLPPPSARARSGATYGTRRSNPSLHDPLAVLGDGEGLAGFHEPLRTAALHYARRCMSLGRRDDELFIEAMTTAVTNAPRRPDRAISPYLDSIYHQRSIDGAFTWLAGLNMDGQAAASDAPPLNRAPPDEARGALRIAVGAFFADADAYDSDMSRLRDDA
jgi:hypothetical protein